MRNLYIVDDETGFFTAVFNAYKDENAFIVRSDLIQSEIGDKFITVIPDDNKAKRVISKILQWDERALREIDNILRTPYFDSMQTAFAYIKLLEKYRSKARNMFTVSEVRRVDNLLHKVGVELDHMYGFIRFHETKSGVFYAAYSPDNDLTELLMPHFFRRLNGIPFIIHDVKRKLAGISNGNSYTVVNAPPQANVVYSDDEDAFLSLWKKYYHTLYIPARKHMKQMKQSMPVRYWKFIDEKEGDEIR